ncbi:MAG: hypothetical protein HY047_01315, partial [Acidobacteria bacterium]|nr:hypothetical protein [Acidobacteriota bacterium]
MKHLITAILILIGAGAIGRTAPAETSVLSLSEFFRPGVVFQDRNHDGVVDFVDARLVMPEHPTAGDLSAAADIAARLGFETTAMNLPVARKDVARADVARAFQASGSGATIFIGAKSLIAAGVSVATLGGAGLKAGDGLVAAFTVSGQPAVAVLGGDDSGLNAAAVTLAGHLPYVWDQKGPTTDKIADDVRQWLVGKGVTPAAAVAPAISVRSNADGVERVVVDVQLAAAGDLVKAQVALNQFKATGGTDPKRALSYGNVRSLRVRLRAPVGGVATVDLPGAGLRAASGTGLRGDLLGTGLRAPSGGDPSPTPPPARRPGGGAKENFDLSTFYANEGALADSDNNLIPDRVDVLLSADGDGADGVVDLAARLGLESTGVSLPIAKPASAITAPEGEPILVLIGVSHPAVDQLVKNHKWERPALQPGEGLIQLVKKAFGEKSALI